MGERGPKSENNLIHIAGENAVEKKRPKPFYGMSYPAKRVWTRIVEDLPVGFYKQHELDLLREYCETAARLTKAKSELEKTGGEVFQQPIVVNGEIVGHKLVVNPWMDVITRSNGTLCSLATKLRLAKNSKLSNQDAVKPMNGRNQSVQTKKSLLFGGREF